MSENTLKQWRSLRKGPGFIKFNGRFIRYPQRELMDWIEAERAATGVY
ncbi:MAG: helix-turn-helix domain-containing protein [Planctomycetes bacterium]|nr:helix-turn-helix domain-containing protein [Planctomycetota bacterium]